jgi:hypothetical protein
MDAKLTPRAKMDCVLRCVLQLKQGLLESLAALGRGGKVGADELFPVFVYVVVQANPPRLHSNLAYVQRWRNPMAFKDEAGCYFTHLQAAVNFLVTLQPDDAAASAAAATTPGPRTPAHEPAGGELMSPPCFTREAIEAQRVTQLEAFEDSIDERTEAQSGHARRLPELQQQLSAGDRTRSRALFGPEDRFTNPIGTPDGSDSDSDTDHADSHRSSVRSSGDAGADAADGPPAPAPAAVPAADAGSAGAGSQGGGAQLAECDPLGLLAVESLALQPAPSTPTQTSKLSRGPPPPPPPSREPLFRDEVED